MGSKVAGRSLVYGILLVGAGSVGACLLADPPADLPVAPVMPPEIVRVEVQPPITTFLDVLPGSFNVPVALDPRERFLKYTFFVDQTAEINETTSANIDGGTLNLTIDYAADPSVFPAVFPNECHILELVVSYPDTANPLGDSVAWFYSPTRSFDGCPVFDAGTPDAGADATADAGEGGAAQ